MEPVPETAEALAQLAAMGDPSLRAELTRISHLVRLIVPECIGLSLGVVAEGLTFTLVATDDETAALDAIQYLDGGPCVQATVETRQILESRPEDLLDEGRWQLFAQASSAALVQSTLSVPIGDADHVLAGVNLYASTADAFVGHHDQLADALGGWAPGIVANADLTFSTKVAAAEAVGVINGHYDVDLAIGCLAAAQCVSLVEAGFRLRAAANRAGISEQQVARTILIVLGSG